MVKAQRAKAKSIELHQGDLPEGLDFGNVVAVDTETQGLNLFRDRLCLVQLSAGDGVCHLVQFKAGLYQAPRLKALMENKAVTKIFHFARFDVVMLKKWLGVEIAPIFCTKIASRLVRTYTDRHGLKDVTREILGIELSKEQQSSDWAASDLSPAQLEYAAADVLHLHQLRNHLIKMLVRENRLALAEKCFEFLKVRGELDSLGWQDMDIFSH